MYIELHTSSAFSFLDGSSLPEALVKAYQTNPALNAERARQRATDENVPQALAGYRETYGEGVVEIAETPDGVDVPAGLTEQLDRAIHEFEHAFAVITG